MKFCQTNEHFLPSNTFVDGHCHLFSFLSCFFSDVTVESICHQSLSTLWWRWERWSYKQATWNGNNVRESEWVCVVITNGTRHRDDRLELTGDIAHILNRSLPLSSQLSGFQAAAAAISLEYWIAWLSSVCWTGWSSASATEFSLSLRRLSAAAALDGLDWTTANELVYCWCSLTDWLTHVTIIKCRSKRFVLEWRREKERRNGKTDWLDRGKWGNATVNRRCSLLFTAAVAPVICCHLPPAVATLIFLLHYLCSLFCSLSSTFLNLLPVSWGTKSLPPGRRLRRSSRLFSRLNLAAWLRANSARSSL